jgi:hypothetical protein
MSPEWAAQGSTRVQRLAEEVGGELAEQVFERPGGVRRLLEELGPAAQEDVASVMDDSLDRALLRGLPGLADVAPDFVARDLARRLGGTPLAQHALRFTLAARTARSRSYTVTVSG